MKRKNDPKIKSNNNSRNLNNGRRKLEFEKGRSPLTGKVIYLDLKDVRQIKSLEAKVKLLGGTIEKFLVRDVNYVISCNVLVNIARKSGTNHSCQSIPSPFSLSQSPSPRGGANEPKTDTVTRGKAMLQIAKKCVHANHVLTNAEKMGIKIIAVEAAVKWLDKEVSKCKLSAPEPAAPERGKRKPGKKIQSLKTPFIKFEAVHNQYRPLMNQLDTWPRININTTSGTCPFDGRVVGRAHCSVRVGTVDTPQAQRDDPVATTTQGKTLKAEGSTCRLFGVQILIGGGVNREKMRRRDSRRKGYCECCKEKYDDVVKHTQSEAHQMFIRDGRNFRCLDKLIKGGKDVASFLQDALLRDQAAPTVENTEMSKCETRLVKKVTSTVLSQEKTLIFRDLPMGSLQTMVPPDQSGSMKQKRQVPEQSGSAKQRRQVALVVVGENEDVIVQRRTSPRKKISSALCHTGSVTAKGRQWRKSPAVKLLVKDNAVRKRRIERCEILYKVLKNNISNTSPMLKSCVRPSVALKGQTTVYKSCDRRHTVSEDKVFANVDYKLTGDFFIKSDQHNITASCVEDNPSANIADKCVKNKLFANITENCVEDALSADVSANCVKKHSSTNIIANCVENKPSANIADHHVEQKLSDNMTANCVEELSLKSYGDEFSVNSDEDMSFTNGCANVASGKVKLNASWSLLSNRSISRLLVSEDVGAFDGFHQTDAGLPSNMSFDEVYEVNFSENSQQEWVIDNELLDNDDDEVLTCGSPRKVPSVKVATRRLDSAQVYSSKLDSTQVSSSKVGSLTRVDDCKLGWPRVNNGQSARSEVDSGQDGLMEVECGVMWKKSVLDKLGQSSERYSEKVWTNSYHPSPDKDSNSSWLAACDSFLESACEKRKNKYTSIPFTLPFLSSSAACQRSPRRKNSPGLADNKPLSESLICKDTKQSDLVPTEAPRPNNPKKLLKNVSNVKKTFRLRYVREKRKTRTNIIIKPHHEVIVVTPSM